MIIIWNKSSPRCLGILKKFWHWDKITSSKQKLPTDSGMERGRWHTSVCIHGLWTNWVKVHIRSILCYWTSVELCCLNNFIDYLKTLFTNYPAQCDAMSGQLWALWRWRQLDLAAGEITHQVVKSVGQAMSVGWGTPAASNTDVECRKIRRPETELWVRRICKLTKGLSRCKIDILLNFNA